MGNNKKNSNIDITGQRFGRLTAIKKVKVASWLCKCDCGNEVIVPYSNLANGTQKSCGCWRRESKEIFAQRVKKHGGNRTPIYNKYCAIKQRCYNPNNHAYNRYGGRGIKMCDKWLNSFESFRQWAYANGYDENGELSLDRIDNNGDYSPENCRFTSRKEQQLNRECAIVCEYEGVKYTAWNFAKEFGITSPCFVRKRVKAGISASDILTEWEKSQHIPSYLMTVEEAAEKYGKTAGHIRRMLRDGKLKGERINWKWYVNKEQD